MMISRGMIPVPHEKFWIRLPTIGNEPSLAKTIDNLLSMPQLEELKLSAQNLEETLPNKIFRFDKPGLLELVNPFLYCFVDGVTLESLPSNYTFEQPCVKYMLADPDYSEKFQLLPTEFYADPKSKKVTAKSYINNLDPRKYRNVYKSIEHVVEASLPHFEKVLSKLVKLDVSNKATAISLSGRPLQIIVGMKNIKLTPNGTSKYVGSSWHIEGMKNERIVASAIYYYDVSNIWKSQLAFRVQVDDKENYADLGYTIAASNRLVVFPNIYEHIVRSFELQDNSISGHRKFVTLFLVDPATKIISTNDVAPQQKSWYPITRKHSSDLFQDIGKYSTSAKMTLEMAKMYENEASAQRGVKITEKRDRSPYNPKPSKKRDSDGFPRRAYRD